MSYWNIAAMAQNIDLQSRIFAAGAQEHVDVNGRILEVCSAPGWADAWESAAAAGNEQPGRDEAVITDPMILAAVQQLAAES